MDALKLIPLSEILLEVTDSDGGCIYLQGSYPWNLETLGLIYITDRYGEKTLETEAPQFCQLHRLECVMNVYEAQDVIYNSKAQKQGLLMQELLACFNHYSQYGGYLRLSNTE
jgi:hypothetical protein